MNKSDRLGSVSAVAEALAYAKAGLAELGIEPLSPVIALSARAALAAKTPSGEDPEALAASGWPEVEQLVERVLFGQSDALRQRVLLERARRALEQLVERVRGAEVERQHASAAHERVSDALRSAGARIAAEREALERRLADVLERTLERVRGDVRPALGLGVDAGAGRFVVARAREAMGADGAAAIVDWLGLDSNVAAGITVELERRVGIVSAALAPQLLGADWPAPARPPRQGADWPAPARLPRQGADWPAAAPETRAHWIRLAANEAADLLAQALAPGPVPPAGSADRRALALAEAFAARTF
jgi:hypothetical protein